METHISIPHISEIFLLQLLPTAPNGSKTFVQYLRNFRNAHTLHIAIKGKSLFSCKLHTFYNFFNSAKLFISVIFLKRFNGFLTVRSDDRSGMFVYCLLS